MKRSKISMIAGGFILAIASVFAEKANRKFMAVSMGYGQGGNIYWKAPIDIFTDSNGNIPIYVELVTANGGFFLRGGKNRLYTVELGEAPLYIRP
jgi:hypothetical protein